MSLNEWCGGEQVGYFHGYLDGVDYVFVDHPAYHHVAHDLYAGSGPEIQFRCALLCKVLHRPLTGHLTVLPDGFFR